MNRFTQDILSRRKETLVLFALCFLVLAVYWQVSGFEFILLDDRNYIYENAAVIGGLSLDSIQWAFTTFHMANWHPLTWLSHLADSSAFGLNPGSHHATNVILHLINTILSFWVFRELTGSFWKSALVAALFAVHPAHVESVAWVSERKDVLSTMFWLLTMFAYAKFATLEKADNTTSDSEPEDNSQHPDGNWKNAFRSRYYWLAVILFAVGLMAKPMLVTLPFVLILLDYWPLRRLVRPRDLYFLLIEKLPFFLLAAASSVVTVVAQKAGGAVQNLDSISFITRVENSFISFAKYLFVLIYPVDLGVYYPYEKSISMWQLVVSIIVLAGITCVSVWQSKPRKYLIVGWLWYLGTLIPVIGLVQVGGQSMADRYTYIPFFGLFLMVLWAGEDVLEKFKDHRSVAIAIGLIVVITFSILSFRQVSYWKNDETLFRHTLAITESNYMMALNYCYALMLEERLAEAETQCRNAISFNPKYVESYISLGVVQIKQERFAQAEESFKKALEIAPGFSEVYINLATSQSLQGKTEDAEKSLETAATGIPFERQPKMWINAINNLALAYEREGKKEKAAAQFERIINRAPGETEARARYALNLLSQKEYRRASEQIAIVIKMKPEQPEAYNLQGLILLEQDKKAEAAKAFEDALSIKPDFAEARKNLERARN